MILSSGARGPNTCISFLEWVMSAAHPRPHTQKVHLQYPVSLPVTTSTLRSHTPSTLTPIYSLSSPQSMWTLLSIYCATTLIMNSWYQYAKACDPVFGHLPTLTNHT